MNYIGEFSKNSTILLELLTKDELDQPLRVDNNPQATIEYYDENGITIVENVTLNTMENDGEYSYTLEIPYDWKYGTYLVTYSVSIDGEEYTTQETFQVSETKVLLEQNKDMGFRILDLLDGGQETSPEVQTDETPLGESGQYIYPPDFQVECDLIPTENGVILRPKSALQYNYSFMVVLGKEISSIAEVQAVFTSESTETSVKMLNEDKYFTFTSEYKPLYATPLEVRSVLKEFFTSFKLHDIYVALRDAGEKAHQYLGEIADANNSRFELVDDRDDAYFPLTKYVLYEASRTLLTNLLIKMLNGSESDGVFVQGSGSSIKLGDFSVDTKQSGGSGTNENSSKMNILNAYLNQVESELKFWQDSMLGRNKRGYATPISAITRSSVAAPESRDF